MRVSRIVVMSAAGFAALWSLTTSYAAGPIAAPPIQVAGLESPARPNSGQPQLAVSDRGILLSWIERDGAQATLKFAERTATGWTAPKTVAAGDDWFVNWADVPSVLRLADGTLAAHWLQKSGPGTYAYDVRLAYSRDDGRTWSPSFTPHHDGTKTEHGFASLFDWNGGLGLVWLDGREMSPGAHDAAGAHDGGAMTLRFATFDRSWKQTSEMAIDRRVCECCPTSAVVTSEGIITAYRDRSQEEIRDIHVSRFANGRWTDSVPVHADNWQINACPVNGPMLAARGRDVVLAWFTGKEMPGHVYVAFSRDAGRTFGAPVRVDDQGSQGRVDVDLLADGAALVSWMDFTDRRAEFRVRRIDPSGAKGPAVTVAPLAAARSSGYPRIARSGDDVVFAWVDAPERPAGGTTPVLRVLTAAAKVSALTGR